MTWNSNKCPHMDNVVQSLAELCKLKQGVPCSECDASGPNLWICLDKNCLYTGCSEQYNDHSTKHFKLFQSHSIHMNLSSQRIWCYLCQQEVFLGTSQRRSSPVSSESGDSVRTHEKIMVYDRAGESCGESSAEEEDLATSGGDRRQLGGLVGLQNIANTCYMNAALQALSNTPPLTGYFLDCGTIAEYVSEQVATAQQTRKPGLAKSYHRLIREIWCRNHLSSGYVVPSGILHGIRSVHPMFRGFQQHDTQEFLRCFMDQLHEELKEITPPPPNVSHMSGHDNEDDEEDERASVCSTPSLSQSEAEYETCDSGVSEQSTASDEGESEQQVQQRRRRFIPASPQHQPAVRRVVVPAKSPPLSQSSAKNAAKHSIISDVFDGKLLSSVQCLTCDRVSTREETFQDLSLPIPGKDHLTVLHQTQQSPSVGGVSAPAGGAVTCTDTVYPSGQDGWLWWLWSWLRSWFWGPAVTLHDCMAAFFSADELKNDNMYSCEKCNKLRNGIKYSRVLALPEMLCVHLKRFRHDLSYSSKISSPVHFPLYGLDMRPYLHRDCQSHVSTYDLTAVICHHGTVGGGHYTSFARHDPSGKWFEFDDQLVTQVTPDVVQNCEAYVLFYRKSNQQMAQLRQEALELVNMSPPLASDIRFYVSKQWLNRFNTFAEPGPIDNWALLCPHGGLPPSKVAVVSKLVVPLPQPLWDFFFEKFGGGPACNHFYECNVCKRAAESLTKRQKAELMAFMAYNDEFQLLETPLVIYAISMAWFRQWQLFARGSTTDEPGPINNTSIAQVSDTVPIRCVKPGSDYAQISEKLWRFFHGIYGGGPEILLRGNPQEDKQTQKIEKSESEEMETEEVNEALPEPPPESAVEKGHSESEPVLQSPHIETNGVAENETVEPSPPSALKNSDGSEKKMPKNVSFEDVDSLTNGSSEKDHQGAKDDTANEYYRSHKSRRSAAMRFRQNSDHNRDEVKHRKSMKKSNNLFGPEGKFAKIIPDDGNHQLPDHNSTGDDDRTAAPKMNGVTVEESGESLPLMDISSSVEMHPIEIKYSHSKGRHRRKRINPVHDAE
ncbi:Ubiquitin carboxyl-terminal hydrolase [Sergentomyia squamirostris]